MPNIDFINMNVHHLELFYYVARAGGIVAACREIPYGIQQPAVSAQMAKLEADLGARLFERRPFALTEAGRTLFDFIAPFFGRLGEVEAELQGRVARRIRLAGLTEVMRQHVPALLAGLRKKFPDLRVTLQEIAQRGAERLIAQGEADLAITVIDGTLPPGFRSIILARLPVCLLVPASGGWHRAGDVLAAGAAGKVSLVSLPPDEMLPRMFHRELARRGIAWKTDLQASAQELVAIYVRHGLGVGLAVRTPEIEADAQVRVLPLRGFPPLPIGVFWRGRLGEAGQAFLDGLVVHARTALGGGSARKKVFQPHRAG